MNARISQELQHLTAAEKHALGEALIGSADTQASSPISQAQTTELLKRLAQHRANPDEPGLNFAQLKIKLKSRSTKHGLYGHF
jgi:putative addiction module component (TIGR02574 family)